MCRHIYLYRDQFLYMPSSYAEWSCYCICCELTHTERRVKRDTASDLCIFAIFAWKLPNIPTTSLSRFIANSIGDHSSTGTWIFEICHHTLVVNGHIHTSDIHTTTVATYQTSNLRIANFFQVTKNSFRAKGHLTAVTTSAPYGSLPILKHNTTCKVYESHMKAHFCPGV